MGILNNFRKGQEDFDAESAIYAWFDDYQQPVGFRDFIIANAVPAPPLYRGVYFWNAISPNSPSSPSMEENLKSWKAGWNIDPEVGDFAAFSEDFDVAAGFAEQGDYGAVIEIHGAKGIRVADHISAEAETESVQREKEWLVSEFSGKMKSYNQIDDYLVHVVME